MTIKRLVIRPEKIKSKNKTWKVGDILIVQENRQFRISDWDWQYKDVEIVELEADERNHPDYIDGKVNTNNAKERPWPSPPPEGGEYYTHPDFGDVPYPNGRCG